MAIALSADTPVYGGFTTGTSHSFNFTVASANSVMIVAVQGDFSDAITGATYNGTAMTLIGKVSQNTGIVRWIYLFYLYNPATGTNSVTINASSSVFIQGMAYTLDGGNSSPQDSTANETGASGTSNAFDTTVVASNCWLVLFAQVASGGGQGPVTAGTGIRRVNDTSFGSCALIDSNATVGTGSQSLTANWTATGPFEGICVSVKPDTGGGGAVLTPYFFHQHVARQS